MDIKMTNLDSKSFLTTLKKTLSIGLIIFCLPTYSNNIEKTPAQKLADLLDSYEKTCLTEDCATKLIKMRKFARWGEVRAQLILGMAYLYGDGVEQDTEESIKWFKRATHNDLTGKDKYAMKAIQTLEKLYREGIAVQANQETANKYLNMLIKHNYGPSLYKLAFEHLENGKIENSITYLEKASLSNYSPAVYALAQIYQQGELVQQDLLKSANYYEKLVIKDYRDSREQLTLLIEYLERPTNQNQDNKTITESLAKFQQSLDMEVITVNPNSGTIQDSLTASLNRFNRHRNKYTAATGSRIKGKPCGKTSRSCRTLSEDELEMELDATGGNQ